jgi:hypothetical protein
MAVKNGKELKLRIQKNPCRCSKSAASQSSDESRAVTLGFLTGFGITVAMSEHVPGRAADGFVRGADADGNCS